MSLIPYDLNKLKSEGVPAEALTDWLSMVTDHDVNSAHQKMVSFYHKYGEKTFWLFKDQQMQARGYRTLDAQSKATYIQKMLSTLPN